MERRARASREITPRGNVCFEMRDTGDGLFLKNSASSRWIFLDYEYVRIIGVRDDARVCVLIDMREAFDRLTRALNPRYYSDGNSMEIFTPKLALRRFVDV